MVLKTKIALALVAFILLHLSCEIQVRNGRKIPGQLVKVYLLTHAFKRSCRNWNFMDVQYWPVNDNQVVFSNRSGSSSCYEFLVGVLWTAWQQQKKRLISGWVFCCSQLDPGPGPSTHHGWGCPWALLPAQALRSMFSPEGWCSCVRAWPAPGPPPLSSPALWEQQLLLPDRHKEDK